MRNDDPARFYWFGHEDGYSRRPSRALEFVGEARTDYELGYRIGAEDRAQAEIIERRYKPNQPTNKPE